MPFYKILKLWFIPPGVYVTLFALLTLYLAVCVRQSGRAGRGLHISLVAASLFCLVLTGVTYTISCNAGAQRLLHSLEYQYPRQEIKPDAIFVLASGMDRINAGVALYKKHHVDVVLSGYNGSAANMQRVMLKKGVPAEKMLLEPEATNTKDHVTFMLPIAQLKGYKQIYLVTSAYHMPRSMLNFEEKFRAVGIAVYPYCCGYTVPKEHRPNQYEWLPNMASFVVGAKAWHEYLGMLDVWLGLPF